MHQSRRLHMPPTLPKFLWKEALKYAMWIRNRTTTHLLSGMTPYEAFYGVKPDIGDIHLWGSRVWVRDLTAGKLDPRGREGRFIGYDAESKGCRIYWPSSRSIGVERDLIFEDRPVNSELIFLPEPSPMKNRLPAPPAVLPEVPEPPSTQPTPEDVPSDEPTIPEVPPQVTEPETPGEAEPPPKQSRSVRGPSRRIREPSRYVREMLEGTVDGGTAQGKSRLPKGVQLPTGMTATEDLELELESEATACLANENRVIEVAMASAHDLGIADDDPKSLAEAMARQDWPEWKEAMDEELALMAKYDVWDEVGRLCDPSPPHRPLRARLQHPWRNPYG